MLPGWDVGKDQPAQIPSRASAYHRTFNGNRMSFIIQKDPTREFYAGEEQRRSS
jgi:hypothetical protein